MTELGFVNLFCRDIDRMVAFYQALLALEEIPDNRTAIFRALRAGPVTIGFSAWPAYPYLGLDDLAAGQGVRALLSFAVDSEAEIDRLATLAAALQASIRKPPGWSSYRWYQTVLVDPEGNALRLYRIETAGRPAAA